MNSRCDDDLFFSSIISGFVDVDHNTRFLRRDWLAARLDEKLRDAGRRFVLLTAVPGAGKSAFMAQLAHDHPEWLPYFIRRDQCTPLSDVSARSLLFRIGYQLVARHPELFLKEPSVPVEQHIGRMGEHSEAVGAEIKRLIVSPFFDRNALRVKQFVQENRGTVVGLRVEELVIEERLLATTDLLNLALIDPAKALLRLDPTKQIVILIDALDEIRYHQTPENILAWLTNCPQLPENIRFVLTSRPPDEPLKAFLEKQAPFLSQLAITEDDPHVKADIAQFVERFLAEKAVVQEMARIEGGAEGFEQQVIDKARGNLGYLDALARGIDQALARKGSQTIQTLLSLNELPTNLEGLYAFFLHQIKQGAGGQIVGKDSSGKTYSTDVWPAVYEPVLGVLTVAAEPLEAEMISKFGGIAVDPKWVRLALDHLRQFLDVVNNRYRLYHATVAEFLAADKTRVNTATSDLYQDAERWHGIIAHHYRAAGLTWASIKWDDVRKDSGQYAFRHLTTHLREAGEHEELFDLLEADNWYLAQMASDSTGTAFLADLAQGSSAADAINSQAIQDCQPAPLIGREIRIALSVASLHGLSENIPIGLLTALVKHGLWSIEQALAAARRNPDPRGRADDLRVLSGLDEAERMPILREALLSAHAIDPTEWQRLDVLRRLIPELPEPLIEIALDSANKIQSAEAAANELAILVPFLPRDQQVEVARTAFESLVKCEWPTTRIGVLESMVEGWPEPLKGQALTKALEEIRAMTEGEEWRARSLASIASKVSGPPRDHLLREAFEATLAIKENEPRETRSGSMRWLQGKTLAFNDLVPQLSGPLLRQALVAAENIKVPEDRSAVLCKFVERLAREGTITEALRVAEAVGNRDRVEALVEMAPFLPKTNDIKAALLLVPNQKGEPHGWPVAVLSVRLAELGDSQAALAGARAIRAPAHRVDALAGIAAKMLAPVPEELIQDVLQTARLPPVQRSLAHSLNVTGESLLALALRLAKEGRVDEALSTARAFPNFHIDGGTGPRVQVLTLLAEHLHEPTQSQTLREAIVAAQVIADGRRRVMIVAELLRQVPALSTDEIQTVLQTALSIVPLISKDDEQAEALGQLAEFLTPPLLEEALVLAQAIERQEDRVLALVQLAPHLAAPQKEQILKEAMDVAKTVKWQRWNERALIEIISQLPEWCQRATLEWAVANNFTGALVALMPRLPEPLQRDAVAALRAIKEPNERVGALSRVAAQLQEDLRRETLAAIQYLKEESKRAKALINLAPWLPSSTLEEALNIAQQITDTYDRSEALCILLPRWADAGHSKEALEVLNQMDWSQANLIGHQRSLRANILAALLGKLPANEREAAQQEAVRNIRKLESKYMFSCAAADLAPCLPESVTPNLTVEAFHATLDNQQWEERADALQALAPHLPVSLLADAVAAAAQLPDSHYLNKSPRAEALKAVARRLATLSASGLYPIWRGTLLQLSRSARPDLLWDLPALCPVMTALGCANAPVEIARAITETAHRWP